MPSRKQLLDALNTALAAESVTVEGAVIPKPVGLTVLRPDGILPDAEEIPLITYYPVEEDVVRENVQPSISDRELTVRVEGVATGAELDTAAEELSVWIIASVLGNGPLQALVREPVRETGTEWLFGDAENMARAVAVVTEFVFPYRTRYADPTR